MKCKFAIAIPVMLATQVFAQGVMPLQLMGKTPSLANGQTKPDPKLEMPPAAVGIDQSVIVQRYGQVISRVPLGLGGLTAWTVEKNGRRIVLYTTGDGQAIISGVVWDSLSGRNLSDQFAPSKVVPASKPTIDPVTLPAGQLTQNAAPQGAALLGKYSGAIPESIQTIDTLAGVREGKGGQADTLYIIFDTRCPYCHKAYEYTRDYVKRGFTIKWIPVVALGNPAQGIPIAATLLQATPAEQADTLRRIFGVKDGITTQPTQKTLDALARNLDFFHQAFKNNRVDQPGVPAAFFLDHRTGKPRMMTGISETPVIEEVFGKL